MFFQHFLIHADDFGQIRAGLEHSILEEEHLLQRVVEKGS